MSRWLVGSSSSSRSGSPASARASEARVSSPPENVASERSRSLVAEAEAVQRRVDALAPAVAAGVLEPRLGGRVGARAWRRRSRPRPSRPRARRRRSSIASSSLAPREHVVAQRQLALARRALVVQRDARALGEHQLAAVDRRLAREHPQQRRLARAVAAGQRHALPALEPERDAAQERLPHHVLGEVGGDDDGHAIRLLRPIDSGARCAAPSTRCCSTAFLLALTAPVALAHDGGEGLYGETNDKVVTNAGFIIIAAFPFIVFLLSMIMWRAGQAQGPPQEGRQGAHAPAPTRAAAGKRAGPVRALRRRRRPHDRPAGAAQRHRRRHRAGAARRVPRLRAPTTSARVLVLTGAGDEAFCAGADLKALETLEGDAPGGPLGFTRLASPKPTIAAVSGWCLAGGFELALWCDLRVAAPSARFGFTERRFGVPLIDGGTQRLPRIVGSGPRARPRAHRPHGRRRGGRAHSGSSPRSSAGRPVERALAMAEAIAAFPQDTLLSDRRAVLEGAGLPLVQGLALEAQLGRGRLEHRRSTGAGGSRPARAAAAARHGAATSATSRFRGYPGPVTRRLTLLAVLAFAARRARPPSAGSTRSTRAAPTATDSWTAAGAAPGSPPTRRARAATRWACAVGGGARVADGATATRDVHRAVRDDDRRLHAHPPADLPQRRAGQRHAPALRHLQARRHGVRRRRPLPERDARPPARPGSWYGYPENNVVVPRSTVSRASFPALAGYAGNATSLQIAVGCFNGAENTACTTAGGGGDREPALGRARRAQRPDAAGRLRRGLRACWPAGARNGSDAVTLDASDNGGIRRVEIIDVLSGGARSSAARTTRAGARTRHGRDLLAPPRARPARTSATRPCARPGWPPAGGR